MTINYNSMFDKKTSKSLDHNVRRFMWVAHYEDGKSLPQFDPKTLEKHDFYDINQDRLVKFGLYPIQQGFAKKLNEAGYNVMSNMFLPKYEINIDDDKRLIGDVIRTRAKVEKYIICKNCNSKIKMKKVEDLNKGSQTTSPICPKCGAHDHWKCQDCGKEFDIYPINKDKDLPSGRCDNCESNVSLKKVTSFTTSEEIRWKTYLIGYQETVNDVNRKTILEIHENGDVEVVYE